jgi:hypothetical protein
MNIHEARPSTGVPPQCQIIITFHVGGCRDVV